MLVYRAVQNGSSFFSSSFFFLVPGRIGKIAGELGRSIKSFREGLGNKEDAAEKTENDEDKS
jgi:Sec-independent protein translocase protein TatA